MTDKNLACIILAAGRGSRMQSKKPKVMHPLAGQPIIRWLLSTVKKMDAKHVITVVAPDMPDVTECVAPFPTAIQEKQKGTGHAAMAGLEKLFDIDPDFKGDVLILLGDAPLVSLETLKGLRAKRDADHDAAISVLGFHPADPTGYGRMLMGYNRALSRIIEHKDCTEEELEFTLCNAGIFCADSESLLDWLKQIENHNAQEEYYLTDLPEIAAANNKKTLVYITENPDEVSGVNTKMDLAKLEEITQKRLRREAMEKGAVLRDPSTVYFSHDTELEQDVMVGPHVVFAPGVRVEEGAKIFSFSHLEGVHVKSGARIGPYARLRAGSQIDEGVEIGNFVEVNRTHIKSGSKAKHVSYLGDAEIDSGVNIGAGTVIANYDGFEKHKTTIGKDVFVGSNSTIISPVNIIDGAIIAAGSTITADIPANALGVGRAELSIKEGWAETYRQKKKSS